MIMSDLFSRSTLPDVVVHTGNSNTWEAEKGGAPVGEQLVYIMTSYLKKQGQRRNPWLTLHTFKIKSKGLIRDKARSILFLTSSSSVTCSANTPVNTPATSSTLRPSTHSCMPHLLPCTRSSDCIHAFVHVSSHRVGLPWLSLPLLSLLHCLNRHIADVYFLSVSWLRHSTDHKDTAFTSMFSMPIT